MTTRSRYMEWVKRRPAARFDLAVSSVLPCTLDDLEGAREAVTLTGHGEEEYSPLVEAIAAHAGVDPAMVTTASGAGGANFQVCAALLDPGVDVLVEQPGYEPLAAAAQLLGARVVTFERPFSGGFAVDPDRVRAALTPRTRLIALTSPHNPTGVLIPPGVLAEIGRIATSVGAHVLVDEVYRNAEWDDGPAAAALGDAFVTTSSLTKCFGLSGLRCGWTISAPAIAERIRRAGDIIDGAGAIPAQSLAVLAFMQAGRLLARAEALLDTNRRALRAFMDASPDIEYVDPGRGTLLFPRIRDVEDAGRFAERLYAERETAVVPGVFFDAPAHFRIGVGGPPEVVAGGLARIRAALDARAWNGSQARPSGRA
jgi:aspartate/methionine/tyrosine aminotransferase